MKSEEWDRSMPLLFQHKTPSRVSETDVERGRTRREIEARREAREYESLVKEVWDE